MRFNLFVDQFIPSGAGFKIVKVSDKFEHGNAHYQTNYLALKDWCRNTCSGIWGMSNKELIVPVSLTETLHKNQWPRQKYASVRYFAFTDEQDILAVSLFLEGVKIRSMWPTGTKFNIFVPSELC